MRTHNNQALCYGNSPGASCWFLVIAAVLVLFVGGTESGAQTPAKPTQADGSSEGAQNGKQLYTSYGCYECHGREGQGSKMSGPRLGPSPIAFSTFARYVRQPKGQMPPYTSKVVSDAELADIYAFLKSLPQPPAAKGIPQLN